MIGIAPGAIVVVAGGVVGVGLMLALAGLMRRPPSLKDALTRLDDAARPPAPSVATPGVEAMVARWHLPVGRATAARLARQNRTAGEFMTTKLVLGLAGLISPALVTGVAWMLGLTSSPWPLAASLVLAVLGFFWPDLTLRSQATVVAEHSADAVSVYFDLVTLIRLGNASAVQALTDAAELTDAAVFVAVREALALARLQQRPPWVELHRLAEAWNLPDVADLADIMALDEQGAALVDVLRARVRELRRAHLAASRLAAQKQAEGMTVWMVVPVLVFALLFLIPPLMTMMSGL